MLVQPNSIITDGNLTLRGYHQLTSLASAVDVPGSGRILFLIPETQAVRIRDDGTDPTATIGFLIPVGMCFKYNGDPSALRVIETAVSATLNILAYN